MFWNRCAHVIFWVYIEIHIQDIELNLYTLLFSTVLYRNFLTLIEKITTKIHFLSFVAFIAISQIWTQ